MSIEKESIALSEHVFNSLYKEAIENHPNISFEQQVNDHEFVISSEVLFNIIGIFSTQKGYAIRLNVIGVSDRYLSSADRLALKDGFIDVYLKDTVKITGIDERQGRYLLSIQYADAEESGIGTVLLNNDDVVGHQLFKYSVINSSDTGFIEKVVYNYNKIDTV